MWAEVAPLASNVISVILFGLRLPRVRIVVWRIFKSGVPGTCISPGPNGCEALARFIAFWTVSIFCVSTPRRT